MYVCKYRYIYIYIYIHREREIVVFALCVLAYIQFVCYVCVCCWFVCYVLLCVMCSVVFWLVILNRCKLDFRLTSELGAKYDTPELANVLCYSVG